MRTNEYTILRTMDRSTISNRYLEALDIAKAPLGLTWVSEIVRNHLTTFPFSSVGPMLGDALPLDVEALYERIVVNRRGGYCFEHNALLFEILRELGFEVELYLGRVIYNQDTHPALTHRISLLSWQGQRYLVDVGFGPLGPDVPVPMDCNAPAQGNHFLYRVHEASAGVFHLQYFKEDAYFSLYKFELAHYGTADCEVGHFYSHKSPQATFVNHLVVSRTMHDEIRSLRNRSYRVITSQSDRDTLIESATQLGMLLNQELNQQVTSRECEILFERTQSA